MKRSLLLLLAGLLITLSAVGQRLPGGAVPEHYSLTFAINFPTNSFEGDETIDLHLLKSSNAITLNALEIDLHDVSVTAGGQTQTATVSVDGKLETATFTVEKPLPEGSASLHMKYTGHLNDKQRGLYLGTSNGRKYAVTQLEATDARVAFPSFDEPAYKATFDITAIVDQGDTVISNNEVISDEPGPGSRHTVRFATTPKMSSYLVALVVGDFHCAHDSVDGIRLGICALAGNEHLTNFAMEATKVILHYYNDYYGIKYPLPKLDQVAVPDKRGAMENWGAIIYGEPVLLADEQTAAVGVKKNVTSIMAHEIAHQWFGDLVTAAWWDDIWLNEGFATWMTPHPMQAWKPDWLVGQDVVNEILEALSTDSVQNTRPIHHAAETRGEIDSVFDGIAYGKTAAVLHMLESYVGPEAFRAGVNLYLKEHAYGNATATDFWGAMTRSSHKPINQIMPTYIMQPGEPYISARCEPGSSALTVSQKRFFNSPEAFNAPNEQKWQVPICAKSADEAVDHGQCFLLSEAQHPFTVQKCSKVLFPNKGAMGYYRYDYDAAAFEANGSSVDPTLSPEERISLVGNQWALMRAGLHDIGDYLALGTRFKDTPGYVLLLDYFLHLDYISREIVDSSDRYAFQAWIRQAFLPLMRQFGYEGRPTDTPPEKQTRALLLFALGGIGDDPEVITRANAIVQQYIKDPGSVESTLARAAVRVAARHGDATLYAQYKAQLQKKLPPETYYLFLYRFAEFPDTALAQQTLAWSLTPEVRSQDLWIVGGRMER